ncbi:hypothetical protein Scep_013896 [Stephania cephalantha]|uniref:Uncharacterized protein n=1 Tax=Stephania cephalantha TaxID=152367 RepID=A0AAP0P156_9MAGN
MLGSLSDAADGGHNDFMAATTAAGDSKWGLTRELHRREEENKGWHPKPPLRRRLIAADAPTPFHRDVANNNCRERNSFPPHMWLTNQEHYCSWFYQPI